MSKTMKENLIALALILGSLVGLAYCPDAEATVYFTTEELDQMEASYQAKRLRYEQTKAALANYDHVVARRYKAKYTTAGLVGAHIGANLHWYILGIVGFGLLFSERKNIKLTSVHKV